MKFLSVCSGIEAASTAWHPLGWEAVAFSEIEKFPSAVLAHHYPNTPNLGDMTKFHEWQQYLIGCLVGGTPCQAFSVAGLREGLNDPRGNLTLTFLAMAAKYRPRWVVWENVPGVLSDRTNAFGNLLAGLGELGYGWAYRVLDAQYFGVAQRRKRVFVVACLAGWERAAEVLFEPESLSGNPPPSREAGQRIAPTLAARTKGGGGLGTDFDCDGGLVSGTDGGVIPIQEIGKRTGRSTNDSGCGLGIANDGDPMFTLQSGAVHGVAHTLKGEGFDASEDGTGRGTPLVPVKWPASVAPTLNASFGSKQGLEDQHALGGGGCSSPHGQMPSPHTTANGTKSPKWPTALLPQISLCLNAGVMGRLDSETETLIPTTQGGFPNDRFLCRNCNRKFGVNDYPRNPTCPECQCMTCDDLLQGHSFPEGTNLTFAEPGSPNNPEPVAIGFQDDTTPKTSEERADAGGEGACVQSQMSVRRLTPTECERLQGFPDDYTNIPWRGRTESPDGPRYKALGNSVAVPVMAWIGKRIHSVNAAIESEPLNFD